MPPFAPPPGRNVESPVKRAVGSEAGKVHLLEKGLGMPATQKKNKLYIYYYYYYMYVCRYLCIKYIFILIFIRFGSTMVYVCMVCMYVIYNFFNIYFYLSDLV